MLQTERENLRENKKQKNMLSAPYDAFVDFACSDFFYSGELSCVKIMVKNLLKIVTLAARKLHAAPCTLAQLGCRGSMFVAVALTSTAVALASTVPPPVEGAGPAAAVTTGIKRPVAGNVTAAIPRVLHHEGQRPDWDAYLHAVYGPAVSYPYRLDRLTWLYWTAPVELNVTCGISFEPKRSYTPHDGEVRINVPEGTAWLAKAGKYCCDPYLPLSDYGMFIAPRHPELHLPTAHGLPSAVPTRGVRHRAPQQQRRWAEVIRHDKGSDETPDTGTWFHGVTGSGMWLELGSQERHLDWTCLWTDALRFTKAPTRVGPWNISGLPCGGVRLPNASSIPPDAMLASTLFDRYDTMQRLYFRDARIELVDLRRGSEPRCRGHAGHAGTSTGLVNGSSCLAQTCGGSAAEHLRVGVVSAKGQATLSPCNCSERHSLLNCGAHDHPLVWELGERVRIKANTWEPRTLVRRRCSRGRGSFTWRPTPAMLAMNEMAARRRRQTGTDRQAAGRKGARAWSASAPQTKDERELNASVRPTQ